MQCNTTDTPPPSTSSAAAAAAAMEATMDTMYMDLEWNIFSNVKTHDYAIISGRTCLTYSTSDEEYL